MACSRGRLPAASSTSRVSEHLRLLGNLALGVIGDLRCGRELQSADADLPPERARRVHRAALEGGDAREQLAPGGLGALRDLPAGSADRGLEPRRDSFDFRGGVAVVPRGLRFGLRRGLR